MGLWKSITKRLSGAHSYQKLHSSEHQRWLDDRGEERRYFFPEFTASDVVVDLGGYEGKWAAGILEKYNVQMHIFEAHPKFARAVQDRFAGWDNVFIHPVALASNQGSFTLSDDGDASSSTTTAGPIVTCRSVEAVAYLNQIGVRHIALLKINIEGGEYEILPHLISTGIISGIDIIQVQFHRYSRKDEVARDAIRRALSTTHECQWCYKFVWEEWRRK
ncbi:FkbM family methyltransferase [Aminobacter sp. HY435]|uniref:FkbM family methyltransferase n=1 Tax=Aminobacter sp. HY435 TaxID=2970917 RepID=UPI0022B96B1B|nr:FkbM family methyltransferase [Aminobacter sp. HY435]